MIEARIRKLRDQFDKLKIDGYVVPKNDEFFSEHSKIDRLKIISNFSGSAGYAIILKQKNYLFVDGRYSLQAKMESGKNFSIIDFHKIINCNLFKNLILGISPKFFVSNQIKNFFLKNNKIELINKDLIGSTYKKQVNFNKPFFSLNENAVGENYNSKINRVLKIIKKNKCDSIFISAPENVAWLLNIRGHDNPNSPIPDCHLFLNKNGKYYLIADKKKVKNLIKDKKISSNRIINPNDFKLFIEKQKKGKILIDPKTCSLFFEHIIKTKFKILMNGDPIYLMKSIKNKVEIKNMLHSHILDGLALTKFIYWIKEINKKKITEFEAQNKLEEFRKKNSNYLYPSFNTIAGAGGNGAIVHYRATKKNTKYIERNDIFLCDSGGQYKYGTTDVTRTICFSKPKTKIKDIFTRVLKGHIAVVQVDLEKSNTGKLIDKKARKYLRDKSLDYEHGTGHGVGFFSNVHEGPQSISKYNNIKIQEGMILSNEPGYYKKDQFGIRIENLIYVKKKNDKLTFDNLTLVPIDKDLIDFGRLTKNEKNYLSNYNLLIYCKLYKFLNNDERKWLLSLF